MTLCLSELSLDARRYVATKQQEFQRRGLGVLALMDGRETTGGIFDVMYSLL